MVRGEVSVRLTTENTAELLLGCGSITFGTLCELTRLFQPLRLGGSALPFLFDGGHGGVVRGLPGGLSIGGAPGLSMLGFWIVIFHAMDLERSHILTTIVHSNKRPAEFQYGEP